MANYKMLMAAVAVAFASGGLAQAQSPTTLRFSSFEPPQAFITKEILTPWAKKVSAESKGTLKIEMYPGGALGRSPAGQLKLVLDGVADIAWIVPGYTPGRFDASTVAALPFIVPSAYAGSLASWRMFARGDFKGGGFAQVKPLMIGTSHPLSVTTTYPATTLADLKGHNFRSAGPISLNVVKALGGVPIGGITGPTLAESLSRGVIQGTLSDWNALQTFRVLDVAKHHIVLPLGANSLMVVMNKAKYESLPKAAKEAIDKNSGEAFSKLFGSKFDANSNAVFEKAKKDKSRVIVYPDAAEKQKWEAAVKPVIDAWVKSTPDGARILEDFRAEVKKIEHP